MESTDKMFFNIAVVLIFAALGSCTAYNVHENMVISDMVKSGADPLTVKCAVSPNEGCRMLAAKD